MTSPTVYRISNHDELFSFAVSAFFDAIADAGEGRIVIALPGGRSIQPFLTQIVREAKSLPRILWSRLEFFMVDERVVAIDHPDSNYRLVREHLAPLIETGLVLEKQFHPFHPDLKAADFGAATYSQELNRYGGRFHVAMLGVGEDAHVGALFPQHHSIRDEGTGYISLNDSPKPPPQRVTASRALLLSSSMLGALVLGEAKRQALELIVAEQGSVESCPARITYEVPGSYIFTDLA